MTRYRLWFNIILLLSMLILLSGCWDRRELEERVSVVAIGIDRVKEETEGGTEKTLYKLTLQIPIPIQIAGGSGEGGGGTDPVQILSSTGETVAAAFTNIQKRLNQQLFMGHTRVIAISNTLAREGVTEVIDGFRRDPSFRRLLWFLVVDGEASKLLEAKPKLEQIPTVFIMSMIENGSRIGTIPDVTLGTFYIALSNTALQPIVNHVRVNGDDITWIGTALFYKDKMIGELTSEQSWFLMHLRNEAPGGDLLVFPGEKKDPKNSMVIRPKNLDTTTNIKIQGDKIEVHYHVYIQANIMEKSFEKDMSNSRDLQKLAKETEKDLEEKSRRLIDLLQKKYKVDVLKLGSKIKAYHYNTWRKIDWKEAFPKADIRVTYEIKFRRTGMQMK